MGEVKNKVLPTVLQELNLITNTPLECFRRLYYGNPESTLTVYPVWLGFGSCTVDSFGLTYPETGNRSTCIGDSGSSIFWEDFSDKVHKDRAYMIGKIM